MFIRNWLRLDIKPILSEKLAAGLSTQLQQTRNTYVLKRRWGPHLSKVGRPTRRLQNRNFVYELVEDTWCRKHNDVKLIMMDDVEGVGIKGEVVNVRPFIARNVLLPSNKAVYASPANLAVMEEEKEKGTIRTVLKHSSPWAPKTARTLSKFILSVVMNNKEPWSLEPWHIRVAFRNMDYIVPDDAITMPEKNISGPDSSIDNKEFLIKVTINKMEQVHVRCRIHHWDRDDSKRVPILPQFWKHPTEAVFPHDEELLKTLPEPDYLLSQKPEL